MFGYVKTDMPNMYVKDTILYKAMYCGLCKGIGKTCGQKGRALLSYDLTFLSVLLHNICDIDVEISKQKCVAHVIRKRPIASPDALTERIACLNVILAFHKLNDDVIDNGKGKLKRSYFKSSYKKAKAKEPVLDKIVQEKYAELLKYEKQNLDSVDIVSDPFANMIVECVKELSGEFFNETVSMLAYYLGKWIYLIDALDDFEKDKKNKDFNVLVNYFNDVNTKEELFSTHGKELINIFSDVLFTIEKYANDINYKFNSDLIKNILILGIKEQTKTIMEKKKCKNTTKS